MQAGGGLFFNGTYKVAQAACICIKHSAKQIQKKQTVSSHSLKKKKKIKKGVGSLTIEQVLSFTL